jgi:tetratricopeptide (TPR) repeat protein
MSRGLRVLIVVSVLLLSAALAAGVIWQAEAQGVASSFVLGVILVVVGGGALVMHLTLSDDFLRRQFGEPDVGQVRRTLRGGWVGVLLGAALLGLHYFDQWVQASYARSQFTTAYSKGLSAVKARDWQTAADALSEAIRLAPPDADLAKAYAWRGVARSALKGYYDAIDDFSEALRLDPENALAYRGRGYAWGARKEYDRAFQDYDEAIRLDPQNAITFNSLARLLATAPEARGRDGKRAVELAKQACELTKWEDRRYLDTLAASYAEAGDFEKAVEYQKKVLEDQRFAQDENVRARLKLYEQKQPARE